MATVIFGGRDHSVPAEWLQGVLIALEGIGFTGIILESPIERIATATPTPGYITVPLGLHNYRIPTKSVNIEQLLIGIGLVLVFYKLKQGNNIIQIYEGVDLVILKSLSFDDREQLKSLEILRGTELFTRAVEDKKQRVIYTVDGKLHKIGGPAIIDYSLNGRVLSEFYFVNGLRHRVEGPAMVSYFENGRPSEVAYFINGVPKRTGGGPVIIDYDEHGRVIAQK
jgi:hypothetical protein